MRIAIINDWKSNYGGALIMIAWFKLDEYRSFSIVLLGVGVSFIKGELPDVS